MNKHTHGGDIGAIGDKGTAADEPAAHKTAAEPAQRGDELSDAQLEAATGGGAWDTLGKTAFLFGTFGVGPSVKELTTGKPYW